MSMDKIYEIWAMKELYEGLKVKLISGDRDRVGSTCKIQNVQNDGGCEVSFGPDYMYSNVDKIQTNPNKPWDGYDMVILTSEYRKRVLESLLND